MIKHPSSLIPALLVIAGFAGAQQDPQEQPVEEIVITGVLDTSSVETGNVLVPPADTARLLRSMPGADVNKNGELTGLVQYRGMAGQRVNVTVDGARISSSGPNAMDAPLHYAPVALLEEVSVQRGIAPVSSGQETIGGHVEAVTVSGDFSGAEEFDLHSRLYAGGQSVNGGAVGSGFFTLTNRHHLLRASVMREEAGDMDFDGGGIVPSEYRRDRFGAGYGFRHGRHEFSLDFARNETGNAGTASLPMDIQSVDSNLVRGRYRWEGIDYTLTTEASVNDLHHAMSNYHLRRPPVDDSGDETPALFRRTVAGSDNVDFRLQLEAIADNGLWRYGLDGHFADHWATVSNPEMAAFSITGFNGVDRDILGVYVEREMALSPGADLKTGVRVNHVNMEAEHVSANLNPMGLTGGMPVMMNALAGRLADRFNALDRSRRDDNVDWFARLSLEGGAGATWYAGLARKTRSPSYQERYLWLPLETTGGLADGNTYVGQVDLKPEVAHEIELGLDWEARGLTVYPRIFYKRVDDYIQGTPADDDAVNNFAGMMAAMGMGSGETLRFSNTEASFYGLDIESTLALSRRLDLRTVLSVVRGVREDIRDDLYRIAPDNVTLALDYRGSGWQATLENIVYSGQDRVSHTNGERPTAGYALVNASVTFRLFGTMEAGVGIDNLFDRHYRDHLAGYNRAFNPDIAPGSRLPGPGRNLYARVLWEF